MVGIKHESMRKGQTSHKKEHNTRMCFPLKPVFTRDKGGLPNFMDEPTTALDVTIQQQILIVLKRLIHKNKMALLIISHDMGVISMMAEWISVMYGGEVVEEGAKDDIMKRSLHPYSAKLIEAANNLNNGDGELVIVEGNVPRPGDDIQGCKFSNRCEYCMEKCLKMKPPCVESGKGYVRCWKYVEEQSENVGR